MTTSIDLSAAREALSKIVVEDSRISALRELMPDIRNSLKCGASIKQILAALAPSFDGDERFVARTIAELRRARGGRRKKSAAGAPHSPPNAAQPARKTLTLSRPATPRAEA